MSQRAAKIIRIHPDCPVDVAKDIDHFINWGGHTWRNFVLYGITQFLGNTCLRDKRILDIGTNDGKMAIFLAALGANVSGIDTCDDQFDLARSEARRFGVEDRTEFIKYNGCFDEVFSEATFDIVFTKSVLVLIDDLELFLSHLSTILSPSGRILFIENAYGSYAHHLARLATRREWGKRINLFRAQHLKLIGRKFDIHEVKKSWIRPVYLIMGHKRTS